MVADFTSGIIDLIDEAMATGFTTGTTTVEEHPPKASVRRSKVETTGFNHPYFRNAFTNDNALYVRTLKKAVIGGLGESMLINYVLASTDSRRVSGSI